ncbi:MAG: toll/interleukin-1 receptor domain-containing protein [Planctomycetes bacterium]|nr:toll/interleukin-1 receptor domain-containing protein [Planctomycetota bacterium]
MHEFDDYVASARVFVCHAASNPDAKGAVARSLKGEGFTVCSDSEIPAGAKWRASIEAQIASSHVLAVVWSKEAMKSPWVAYEIGFARGQGVPIFVVTADDTPVHGIVDDIQATRLKGAARRLRNGIASLMSGSHGGPLTVEVADDPLSRSQKLAAAAERLEGAALVRQVAVFSSFSIPSENPDLNPAPWVLREGETPRLAEHRRQQYHERVQLERHAFEAGARLVLCPHRLRRGIQETLGRLATLREFLGSAKADRVCRPHRGSRSVGKQNDPR